MENQITIDQNYIPGVCNIGPSEIARRKQSFAFTFIATLIISIIPFLITLSDFWIILIFLSWTMTGVTFLQVRNRFCVAFGWLSVFNFGSLDDKKTRIQDSNAIAEDRRRVLIMFTQSVLLAFIMTLGLFFITF